MGNSEDVTGWPSVFRSTRCPLPAPDGSRAAVFSSRKQTPSPTAGGSRRSAVDQMLGNPCLSCRGPRKHPWLVPEKRRHGGWAGASRPPHAASLLRVLCPGENEMASRGRRKNEENSILRYTSTHKPGRWRQVCCVATLSGCHRRKLSSIKKHCKLHKMILSLNKTLAARECHVYRRRSNLGVRTTAGPSLWSVRETAPPHEVNCPLQRQTVSEALGAPGNEEGPEDRKQGRAREAGAGS